MVNEERTKTETLKNDNVKMYETIRYLESYKNVSHSKKIKKKKSKAKQNRS